VVLHVAASPVNWVADVEVVLDTEVA